MSESWEKPIANRLLDSHEDFYGLLLYSLRRRLKHVKDRRGFIEAVAGAFKDADVL
ncbi:hypothetical protein [Aestuariicoccus sp. MJ-SS9]|uniref:hypothetical protein n=1 Tax=Aestuariicoccus sp. MJ-SS9 TaxID=3079855 RepID=UPI00290AFE67|nr:hypothetical protein [Aestuariicoccus sp. MJ-SS9]MDU8911677.1 hypothetical protein [Aestuariicoccus sp. MJ-SS9]